jgi:hypothetical protein
MAVTVRAADIPSGADEHFEKNVRPILVEHCYKCHSAQAKSPKGGLRVDGRAFLLKGGDNGTTLVPGNPDKSRLIEAINYKNTDMQMPPKGKLPDAVIADLTRWVKDGAAWPNDSGSGTTVVISAFDLEQRKRDHWAWRPVRAQAAPTVRDRAWVRDPVDAFLLAKLEEKSLKPAPEADRRTWLRRVSFDLIGLPPTADQIEAFLKDDSPTAYEKVVDRLLKSEQFGERWARHWLDLVRYAESRGHEYDPIIPNAYQYRDYVIRALNADVPYNQFVTEHLAGDLLPNPRRHPTDGFNESILGTGFLYLGEEVHSPVDIRQDQADRFDNRIDVLSKTFLGLTVACARCHDHKFDAISQKDYYSLYSFLSSCSYRQVRFDSIEQNRKVADELAKQQEKARRTASKELAEAARPATEALGDYLLAAREAILVGMEPGTSTLQDVVFEDFEKGTYEGWEVTGTAFGTKPQTLETIAPYQGKINCVGKYFVNSHNIRDGGDVTSGDAHKGTMTSKPFAVTHSYITMLVGGGAHVGKTCVNLLIDGKVVLSATGRNDNQMYPVRWDVRPWKGKMARIQAVDDHTGGWGNIGFDQIVFTDKADPSAKPTRIEALSEPARKRLADIAASRKLDATLLERWVVLLLNAANEPGDPLHAWARVASDAKANDSARFKASLQPLIDEYRQRTNAADALKKMSVIVDYATSRPEDWMPDDVSFGRAPVRPGDVQLTGSSLRFAESAAAEYDRIWDVLTLASGSENDPGALGRVGIRAGRTLRTPTFRVTNGKVYALVRGAGSAYASVSAHIQIDGPLHGQLVTAIPANVEFHWIALDLARYRGLDAHLEFSAAAGSDFAVARVVQAEQPPANPIRTPALLAALLGSAGSGSLEALAAAYQKVFAEACLILAADGPIDSETARLANWLLDHKELLAAGGKALDETAATLLAERTQLAKQIKRESRLAPALLDGSPVEEHVFIRGSPKGEGVPAPRRLLEALVGDRPIEAARGSGRLQLAKQITDPAVNPFVARVLVNRVWHHLFGRGIVASVDNFGLLGEAPTHPELLDFLAERFVKEGWSLKTLIRELVLSNAYRMSSQPNAEADRIDPSILMLHRARLRRLEGEAIRDAMLSVSGRLDLKLYGPSVPIYLTPFLDGRGRPGSGPLDGAGRRSLYLAVKRNFLSPMMLAFDTPSPFSTVGRRTVSNVPGQSLILMNDPFVHQQADLWAKRVLSRAGTTEARVTEMYVSAFGRPPTVEERRACVAFLDHQAALQKSGADDPRVWSDLAHTLFNVKEFIFLE